MRDVKDFTAKGGITREPQQQARQGDAQGEGQQVEQQVVFGTRAAHQG